MDILKLVSAYNQESSHTNHIKESRFTQTPETSSESSSKIQCDTLVNTHIKMMPSLLKSILMTLDPMYSGIPEKERRMYLQQRVMEMCSQIDESRDKSYDVYKFHSKKMRPKMIQQNLQNSIANDVNLLSVLYYLTEYYKRHFVIVSDDGYYKTCTKPYPIQTIYYSQDQYSVVDKDYENLPELKLIDIPISIDVKGVPYETGLKAISNYSVAELKQMCESHNISLQDKGKSKKKQQLYDELELRFASQ